MKPLPARGFARALSKVALAGCAISLAVHLVSLAGFESRGLWHFQFAVFAGAILILFLAGFAQEYVRIKFGERTRGWRFLPPKSDGVLKQRVFFDNAPRWLRRLTYGMFAYFVVCFVIAIRVFSG
jgi:hypothetical protein